MNLPYPPVSDPYPGTDTGSETKIGNGAPL
jgi:hypothetical protein